MMSWLVEVDNTRKEDIRDLFIKVQMEPLCGWPWLDENRLKQYPEQSIAIFYDGKGLLATASTRTQPGIIKSAMTAARSQT